MHIKTNIQEGDSFCVSNVKEKDEYESLVMIIFLGILKLLIFFTPRIKIDTTVLDRNAMPIIHIYTLRNNLPSTFFFAFIIIHTKTEQLRILGRASLKVEF